VQRDAIHCGIDPEPVAQSLGTAMGCIGDIRLDHHVFHDLPDPNARERPDRHLGALWRPLRFSDAVCGVEGVEILGGHRDGAVDDLLLARGILALLETAERDRAPRKIDTGRCDFDQLGGTAACVVQRLAKRAVAGRPTLGDREKCRALFRVQVQSVSGIVVEAHFAHI